MKFFLKSTSLFFLLVFIVSCSKSDSSTEPLRKYAEQYATDLTNIEGYMKSHYMTVINNPGATDDQDVTFTKIPTGGTQTSIWDEHLYQTYEITLTQDDTQGPVTYKIYYIQLRQGSGPNSKSPCNVDRVLTSYRGEYIYNGSEGIISKQFDSMVTPETYFNLTGVVRGWSEIFPKFKTGSYTSNGDGTLSYHDFGAGVMFLPSGLAYYSGTTGSIPSYSPLIFTFKLYEVQRTDQDGDGIYSYLEDIGSELQPGVPDGYLRDNDTTYEDDTDHDGTPNYLDTDDDNDLFTTKSEIKDPITGQPYAFDQIPLCSDGKKKHLSTVCH